MIDKLEQIAARYEELTQELSSPELLANPSAYAKAAKQHRTLEEVVQKYHSWKALTDEVAGKRELLHTADDHEMRQLALEELDAEQAPVEETEKDLRVALAPSDRTD